uniref:Uncharacterized protein n=1 Tax=Pseudonaja textilis TaxID=8673 RepID=A0A670ZKB2_PSETE
GHGGITPWTVNLMALSSKILGLSSKAFILHSSLQPAVCRLREKNRETDGEKGSCQTSERKITSCQHSMKDLQGQHIVQQGHIM